MDINFCIRFGFMYNLLIAKCKHGLIGISYIDFCYMPTFTSLLLIFIIFKFLGVRVS